MLSKYLLSLLDDMQRAYLDAVDRTIHGRPHHRAWGLFRRTMTHTLSAVDFIQAGRMQHAASATKKVSLPRKKTNPTFAEIKKVNKWYTPHEAMTLPLIQEQVGNVVEAEEAYYQDRKHLLAEADTKIPDNRLNMLYRLSYADTRANSEQAALADPDVGVHFPYAVYLTRKDAAVRDTHRFMHGFICLRSWEGFATILPPNGYNCRCFIKYEPWIVAVKKGWAFDVGKPRWSVRWPNAVAKGNYEAGMFPDPGFEKERFIAPYPPPRG